MTPLLNFYVNNQGRKYTPLYYGEEYVYLRGDNYGNVSHVVCKITDGQLNINKPIKKFNQGNTAERWVKDHEEGIPVGFVSSEVKRKMEGLR